MSAGPLSYRELDEICQKYKHHLARWRRDPVAFCYEAFHPDKVKDLQYWQAEFMWDLAKYKKVARGAGHGVGKSFVLGRAAWWVMITQKNLNEPLKIPCTGPSGSNIEDVLWQEVCGTYGQLNPFLQSEFIVQKDKAFHISKLNIMGNSKDEDSGIDDGDAWFARLRTARKEQPEALQGFHGNPSLFIIDEAPGVPDEVFDVASGAMAGKNVYGIMFGNPRRLSGYFYDAFHSKKSMWKTKSISCEDNTIHDVREYFYYDSLGRRQKVKCAGRVTTTYIDEMKEKYGEDSATYAFRVRGQFPTSEDDQLIHTEWIQDAMRRSPAEVEHAKKGAQRYMGVDVAYMGTDDSALVVRCGPDIEYVEKWHGHDPSESAQRVIETYNDFAKSGMPIKTIFVDDNGVGAGVTSSLRKAKYPAVPVNVGDGAPNDGGTRCDRLRDWLWWQCRLFFQRGRPRFAETKGVAWELLIKDLGLIQYSRSKRSGKMIAKDKDEMRKVLKHSPDLCDALCLTFFRSGGIDQASSDRSSSELRQYQKNLNNKHKRRSKSQARQNWRLA